MADSKLTKETVADITMSTLAVRFSPARLDVMVYSDMEANSLVSRSMEIDPGPRSWLHAVEDAVYENPLLPAEFRRTLLVIEPEAAMLLPGEVAADADAVKILQSTLGGESREWRVDAPVGRNSAIGYGFPAGLTGFIRRTWGNEVSLLCNLTVLARYFITGVQRGKASRILVNLRDGSLDIIAVEHGGIRLANTFDFRTPDDAVYYVLACRAVASMPHDSEILISGPAAVRDQISPLLRRFVRQVMPVIFPPRMFRAGREAVELPFDLIVSPLCE